MTKYLEEIQTIINHLENHILIEINESSKRLLFKKGTKLLEIGQVCHRSYLVEQGILRKYYYNDEREITSDFYFNQDIAISLESYASQIPSIECIEAITDTVVISTDYTHFQNLKKKYPQLLELDSLYNEYHRNRLESRIKEIQILNATERYENLLSKAPHIIKNIRLTYIASYLNITLETLSRIRKKI